MSWPEIPEEPERIVARPIVATLASVVIAIVVCAGIVWAFNAFEIDHHGASEQVQRIDLQPPARPFTTLDQARPSNADLDRDIERYLKIRGGR